MTPTQCFKNDTRKCNDKLCCTFFICMKKLRNKNVELMKRWKNEFILSRIRLRLTGEDETETKYMQWYTYFLLLIVYVIYLAFGAVVFQAIEQPAEVREFKIKQLSWWLIDIQIAKCDQAKLELKDKIAQFGDEVGFQ